MFSSPAGASIEESYVHAGPTAARMPAFGDVRWVPPKAVVPITSIAQTSVHKDGDRKRQGDIVIV